MKYFILSLFISSFVFAQHTQKDPDTGVISKYSSNGNITERYTVNSNGKYHGKRERWYSTRNSYTTPQKYGVENWKNGRQYGKQTYWHENGKLDMIVYKDDDAPLERYGEFERYYEDGTPRYYSLRNRKGYLIGADKEWDEYGVLIKHHNYKNGSKSGSQKNWNDEGVLVKHYNYEDGKQHGFQKEWEWDEYEGKAILIKHYNYAYGKKHGAQKEYDMYNEGVLMKLENYKNGEKHGLFHEMNRYGGVYYQESWYNGKKHGKWFDHGFDELGPEYEKNYKHGKKDGVWIEYLNVIDNTFADGPPIFAGIKKLQTWKDGKLNGVSKEWGDNCDESENAVMYPSMLQYNLIVEEYYKDGKKHGISKKWSSGSYEKDVWKEGDFISESNYIEGEENILKERSHDGWMTRNHDGLYLDFLQFQDEDFLEEIDETIVQSQQIISVYQNSINTLHSFLKSKIDVINNSKIEIKELETQISNTETALSEYKEKEIGLEKLKKIQDKYKNGKANKKQEKILSKIVEFQNKISNKEAEMADKKLELAQVYSVQKRDSIKLAYYLPFPAAVDSFLKPLVKLKEAELQKSIYDVNEQYSKEFYSKNKVRKLRWDSEELLGFFPHPFSVTKNNIGPFYLGMTKKDLQSFLITDPYFASCGRWVDEIEPGVVEMSREKDKTSCSFICDCRLNGEETKKVETETETENPFFSDHVYTIKYETWTEKNWYRPNFVIYVSDEIVHAISFDLGGLDDKDDEMKLVEAANGMYLSQPLNELLIQQPSLKEEFIFVKKEFSREMPLAYFFDDNIGAYICFDGFTVPRDDEKQKKLDDWYINQFTITSSKVIFDNIHHSEYKTVSPNKIQGVLLTVTEPEPEPDGGGK